MLDQRFAGMKSALENATDDDRAAINQMLDDLNQLLEAHRRGEAGQDEFDAFMDQHGEFFPEKPQTMERVARHPGPASRRSPADAQLDDAGAARRDRRTGPASIRIARAVSWLASSTGTCAPCVRARTGAVPNAWMASRGWASVTAPVSSRTSPISIGCPDRCAQSYRRLAHGRHRHRQAAHQLGAQAGVDARTLQALEKALRDSGTMKRGADGQAQADPQGDAAARARRCSRRRREDVGTSGQS
ncbi:hypothetical protein [Aeromicrobium sp. UC242_57]|uniref:hypothetical protein n=1 Tax=Aeromicrobium sp. UC242_57 TaxID=3374624 RepID=UPI003792B453